MNNSFSKNFIGILILISSVGFVFSAHAATSTWDGGSDATISGNSWHTCGNWTSDSCPGSSDIAYFDGGLDDDANINVSIDVQGIHIASGYSGTVTQTANATVTVGTVGFHQGGGTFVGGNATTTLNGPFSFWGGTHTLTSATTSLFNGMDWTIAGGTFNHGTGTVVWDNDGTDITGSATYYNLKYQPTSSCCASELAISAGTVITVLNDFVLDAENGKEQQGGEHGIDTGEIYAQGNIYVYDNSEYYGTASVTINGTGNQTFFGGIGAPVDAGDGGFPNLEIDKPSGTLFIEGTHRMGNDTNIFFTNGTVDPGGSMISIDEGTTIQGSTTLDNVTFDIDSDCCWDQITIATGTTLTVNGLLKIDNTGGDDNASAWNTGDVIAKGDIIVGNDNYAGNGRLLIQGTGDQVFSGNASTTPSTEDWSIPRVSVDKPSGTLFLRGNIGIGESSISPHVLEGWHHVQGNVNPGNSTLILGLNTSDTYIAGNPIFAHVLIAGNSTCCVGDIDLYGGSLTALKSFTYNHANTESRNIHNGTIYVHGDVSVEGHASSLVEGTATLEFAGDDDQTITLASGKTDDVNINIVVNKTGGTVFMGSDLDMDEAGQDLTITAGTLEMGDYDLVVADQLVISASGTLRNLSTGDFTKGTTDSTITNNGTLYFNGNGGGCGDADSIIFSGNSGLNPQDLSGTGRYILWDVDVRNSVAGVPVQVINGTNGGGNVDVQFNSTCPSRTYDQSGYRWFENADDTDVGSAVAATNTAITGFNQSTPFRLRILVEQVATTLGLAGENFKLQYAEKVGTCDANFQRDRYEDVMKESGRIRWYANQSAYDKDDLTDNSNDPTHGADTIINQDYVEANPFTNTVATTSVGEHSMWDFSLVNHSAPSFSSYCFRVVRDGGEILETYSEIPELTVPARPKLVRLSGQVRLRNIRLR